MRIKVKRIARREFYTIGRLYLDGQYFCDTVEDRDRGLLASMSPEEIARLKVYGETAIPAGGYRVIMAFSPKFNGRYPFLRKGLMPAILDVPGYSGVLIHPGNTSNDSLGCVLVGKNKVVGKVVESRATFEKLYGILLSAWDAGEEITLEIG